MMKKKILTVSAFVTAIFLAALFSAASSEAGTTRIDIVESRWELKPGLTTAVWSYNGTVPGTPIVAEAGERVVVEGLNNLPTATNIHWHGLEVPNDQDGPGKTIGPGERFRYEFTALEPGTYWYHTHQSPVLEQLDRGLYGAFIVRAPGDRLYSGDHVLVLDDWYLDARGTRIEGTARGDMERYGNVETVSGKTFPAIAPLVFQTGELHKLRIINASTAAVHTVTMRSHRFRVTHTDGHPLGEPYMTDSITLSPGERFDAEVEAVGNEGESYEIASGRPELGVRVPVRYRPGKTEQVRSPFITARPKSFPGIFEKSVDFRLDLNSAMGMGRGGMRGGGGGHLMGTTGMMRWTINGRSFPDTEPIPVAVGEVVKVRFRNLDTMMMHPMDHPMHLHGTYFLVVSVNGRRPERETWKDTVNVPAGQYVDVAFVMKNPGDWMLHCHIIDHEDGGMMTVVRAE
jgi:FtsP/CotA-like multicopper oxidase with cupredoxin domain